MADRSRIEWTDATWNPVRGCSRVSRGCQHCYAEGVAYRFGGVGQPYEGLLHPVTGAWNGTVRLVPEALTIPWHWVQPRLIFVNSMSDLFHPAVPFEFIAAVFWVMSVTTRHTYQVLTKRPERMLEFFRWLIDYNGDPDDLASSLLFSVNDSEAHLRMLNAISDIGHDHPVIKELPWEPTTSRRGGYDICGPGWPYENVWLGVSVEDQKTADERIPLLLQTPAAVRWISAEPLLGPIDLGKVPPRADVRPVNGATVASISGCLPRWQTTPCEAKLRDGLDWVVAGGESGHGARPMHPEWARSLRDQCAEARVPFLFKQWGEWAPGRVWAGGDLGGEMRRGTSLFVRVDGEDTDGCSQRDDQLMRRVGKTTAGRLLDGVLHDGYPEKRGGQ